MGTGYNPKIVTDGLIVSIDARDRKSYSGSGSTWKDRSGSGNNGELFNSPTVTSNFGGGISFEETDEFMALGDKAATNYVTVEVWYTRDSEGTGENIVFNKENCWEINDNNGNISWAVMANNKGWFWYDSTANIDIGETVQFVLRYDGDSVQSYKNGTLVQNYSYPSGGVLTNQTNAYPKLNSRHSTRTTIQNAGNHTFYQFRVYDRALTANEISQNFNAQKDRFGL